MTLKEAEKAAAELSKGLRVGMAANHAGASVILRGMPYATYDGDPRSWCVRADMENTETGHRYCGDCGDGLSAPTGSK